MTVVSSILGRSFDRARCVRAGLIAGALFVAVWPFALGRFRHGDVYAVMGPLAIAILVTLTVLAVFAGVAVIHRKTLARDVALGLGCGTLMTALTYVAYAAALRGWPGLAPHVVGLYAASRSGHPGSALAWTLVILAAEETLWRGWLLGPTARLVGRRGALTLSLATYALAQVGSGSGILVLAALVCGAIWLAERAWTGSIVAPLLSHAIWTPVIIHLVPLTVVHPL